MKKLNKNATKIFCRLIERMKGQHLKIRVEYFMPLTVEQIGKGIATPWGEGKLYSLCHYYEQNGDLMQDPEMCFIVVDNRAAETGDIDFVGVYPYAFIQASLAIYQESANIENNKLTSFSRKQQADHTVFANQWLGNIDKQGFLKAIGNEAI